MKLIAIVLIVLSTYCTLVVRSNERQNFCQDNRCLTCVGRYCTTTCQGEGCKECPLGECCDGSNCNICRGENCCATTECNSCITTCLKKCQGKSTCHYDCFQECIPSGREDDGNSGQTVRGSIISNKNYLPVNVTTIINITNTILNENTVHNPILINTTNVNNYTGQGTNHRKQIIINRTSKTNFDANNSKDNNCCEVVHPELCQKVPGQGISLCQTGKHSECSKLCIGKHVHIIQDKEQPTQCIYIAKRPHFFCGNYVAKDCDNCYNCTDPDDLDCTQDPSCPDACKNSIIPKEFYNKLYRKE